MKSRIISRGISVVILLGIAACSNLPGTCDNDADCSEGSECSNGLCVLKDACKPGQTQCDPLAKYSKMQTCGDDGQWGEAVDCLAGQLCDHSNSNSCGVCNSDQQCAEASIYGKEFICVEGNCVEGNCHDDSDCKAADHTCGGDGEANFCGCIEPTDKEICGNRDCGTVTETDSCGNSRTVNCGGECFGAQTCEGAGEPDVCGCAPPPHEPTKKIDAWPISKEKPIPDSAYDYTSNSDEVLDKQTCLVWKKYPIGDIKTADWEKFDWESAKNACKDLGDGWRLPTKVELESIVDHYKFTHEEYKDEQSINNKAFPSTPLSCFWSSDSHNSESAYGVCFRQKSKTTWADYKTTKIYVRCVR